MPSVKAHGMVLGAHGDRRVRAKTTSKARIPSEQAWRQEDHIMSAQGKDAASPGLDPTMKITVAALQEERRNYVFAL